MPTLREGFQTQATAIRRQAPAVGPDADPSELHELRVAIRRLRALLRAARPFLTDERAESLRGELRALGHAIGPARDADVFAAHLRGAAPDLSGETDSLGRLQARAEDWRREAYAAARAALDAPSFDRLLQELDAFCASVVLREPPLRELVRAEGRKLRRAMRDVETDEALHRARIKAKRVRYAAEVAEKKEIVNRAKRFQDVVGEHQDAVFAEERLRAFSEPNTALVVGRLIERQRARRAAARAEVPKAWRKLAKALA